MEDQTQVPSTPTQAKEKMLEISINELKTKLGIKALNIIHNPKTGKYFASNEDGTITLRVVGSYKSFLPKKFIYDSEESLKDGCIVNENLVETL